MGALFWIKVLEGWAFLNCLMTIFEDRGPEIPSAKDFLGCSHPRKMTATYSILEIIQNHFILFMRKEFSKDRIYSILVQCIIHNELVLCVVMDTTIIAMGYVKLKYLGLDIDDQISIPWVSCAYQEQEFIWK